MKIYLLNKRGFNLAHQVGHFSDDANAALPSVLFLYYNKSGTYKDIVHNTSRASFKMAGKLKLLEIIER